MILDIITPEKKLLTEEIVSVTLPTVEGEITVLPRHIPFYSRLNQGELMFRFGDGRQDFVAVHGGFVEVTGEKVTVLADDAVRADDIDELVVQEAKQKAEDAMAQKVTDEDFALAEAAMRKTLLELKVAQRRRR